MKSPKRKSESERLRARIDCAEGMRVDPDVSNVVYNRACRQFDAPLGKRPDFTVLPAVVTKSPYTETETGELNHAFLRIFLDKKHPELTRPAARTAWLYVGGGDGALGVE